MCAPVRDSDLTEKAQRTGPRCDLCVDEDTEPQRWTERYHRQEVTIWGQTLSSAPGRTSSPLTSSWRQTQVWPPPHLMHHLSDRSSGNCLSVPSVTAAELGVSPARRPLSRPSHIDPPRYLNPVGIPESAKGSVIAPSHQTVSSTRSVNAHLHSLHRRKSDCVLREQREAVLGPSRLLLSGLLNLLQGPFCSLMAPGCLQASMMPLRKLEKGALSGQM